MKLRKLLIIIIFTASAIGAVAGPEEAIQPAVDFLTQSARTGGGWSASLDVRTTALGILVLYKAGENPSALGYQLAGEGFTDPWDLIWKCVGTKSKTTAQTIESLQLPNGSWNDDLEMTGWAAWSLAKAGRKNAAASSYLATVINPDGSWGEPMGGRPDLTGIAVMALAAGGETVYSASGVAFLTETRETGEGWGKPYDTALASLALIEAGVSETEPAANLAALQHTDGSWTDPFQPDPRYVTALALFALEGMDIENPAIDTGIARLKSLQSGGAWYRSSTAVLDTAASLSALSAADHSADVVYTKALEWLGKQSVHGCYETSLTAGALAHAGIDATAYLPAIASYRRSSGGFACDEHTSAGISDTREALEAYIAIAGNNPNVNDAAGFLAETQFPDGHWDPLAAVGAPDGGPGSIFLTAQIVRTLSAAPQGTDIQSALSAAGDFLLNNQNPDGSFGSGDDLVVDTAASALALMDLTSLGVISNADEAIDAAIAYLVQSQIKGDETATQTPTPTLSPTPSPTQPVTTDTPTQTEEPTFTPTITDTPAITDTPEPTNTPEDTETPTAMPGDFNRDREVSAPDVFAFGSVWQRQAEPGLSDEADLDLSGDVESGDLLRLIALWHTTYPSDNKGTDTTGFRSVASRTMVAAVSPIGSWNGRVYDTAIALEAVASYKAAPPIEYTVFTISGHVYQSDGTTPQSGAVVRLNAIAGEMTGDVFVTDTTDAQGYYEFTDVEATKEAVLRLLVLPPYAATAQNINVSEVTQGQNVVANFVLN